jgi:hypothetical protein
MKLLEENLGETLQNIDRGNDFLDITPKPQETKPKIYKWNYIKLKRWIVLNLPFLDNLVFSLLKVHSFPNNFAIIFPSCLNSSLVECKD